MGYKKESYCQHTGCVCERCTVVFDDKSRLVIIDTGGSAAYICSPCIKEIFMMLETKCNFPGSNNWTMSKNDLYGWLDPAGRRNGPSPDNLRVAMSNYDEEFRRMMKDFREYNGGYTDRNKFAVDFSKHMKDMLKVIEEYLKKTE